MAKKKASRSRSTKKKVTKKKVPAKKSTPKAEKDGYLRGKTLNLKVQETWVHVFSENAKATKAKRKTDEEINSFMKKEFPLRKTHLTQSVAGVQAARRGYNKGMFTDGEVPVESPRFDEDGNAITARTRTASGKSTKKKVTKKKKASKKK